MFLLPTILIVLAISYTIKHWRAKSRANLARLLPRQRSTYKTYILDEINTSILQSLTKTELAKRLERNHPPITLGI